VTPTALRLLVRVSVAAHVAYRAEMVIWIFTALLPVIMLALWSAVAAGGPLAGYDEPALARYFVAALVCRQLTGAWLVWELNHDIRTGRLSPQLLRPMSPLVFHAVQMVTAMPFRIVVLTPLVLAITVWRPDLFVLPSAAGFALFCVSISMAWLLNFFVQWLFGAIAFWLDKSDGLFNVWFTLWALLSGYIAPLDLFPEWAQPVLAWLPFRSMLAVPIELLGGFLTPEDALLDLSRQVGWTVVFGLAAWGLWRRGLKRYGAFGA
jgi:ABC-2 type transport system permease protein